MGGRGASSNGAGGGGYNATIKSLSPRRVDGSAAGIEKQVNELLKGYDKVMKDFGITNKVNNIFIDNDTKGIASMDGLGNLSINKNALKNPTKAKKGWLTSDTNAGTGAHEAGHKVAHELLKQNMKGRKELDIATARSKGKIEKSIIKEASKRYGSNPSISGYGDKNNKEKVAEAISDVYTNGNKANEYSKVIVNVMKDINNGKFKPRI